MVERRPRMLSPPLHQVQTPAPKMKPGMISSDSQMMFDCCGRGQRDPAIVGLLGPDRDQVLLLRQPADRVHEQVAVALDAQRAVGGEVGVADRRPSASPASGASGSPGLGGCRRRRRRGHGRRRSRSVPSCRPSIRRATPRRWSCSDLMSVSAQLRGPVSTKVCARVAVDAAAHRRRARASGNAVSMLKRSVIGCAG